MEIARGENARHENAGQKNAGHKNAGLENAGRESRRHETTVYVLLIYPRVPDCNAAFDVACFTVLPGSSKTQNGRFPSNIVLHWKKVCYKVFCVKTVSGKVARHSLA